MCDVLQQNLASDAAWYVFTPDVICFGPTRLHGHAHGDRFFRIVAQTGKGTFQLFVSVGVSDALFHAVPEAIGLVAEERTTHALKGHDLEEVFASLSHTDIDIQIEVPVSLSRTEVHYAKIVTRKVIDGRTVLAVFLPALVDKAEKLAGTEVLAYLPHRGRLYQFRATIFGVARVQLESDTRLRLLAIEAPTTLTPGQRRRAYRVTLVEHVAMTVERWVIDDDGEVYETATPVSATLYDISIGGARASSLDVALGSTFATGNLVLCTFCLRGHSPISVPGIARRKAKVPTRDGDRYDLGIEFLNNPRWKTFAAAFEDVAAFVRSEELRSRQRS